MLNRVVFPSHGGGNEYFELDPARAREMAAQVGKVVSKWCDEVCGRVFSKNEIDRMASLLSINIRKKPLKDNGISSVTHRIERL